jgi:hypothetical protein
MRTAHLASHHRFRFDVEDGAPVFLLIAGLAIVLSTLAMYLYPTI